MGIEIPNLSPNTVDFKEVLENQKLNKNSDKYNLPAPLGQGMDGIPKVIDLSKMPHLLVAGSTGSGRMAISEIHCDIDTPVGVIVNESVKLADINL